MEVRTMCDVLDRIEERGKKVGIEIGKEIGKEIAILQSINNLMESMKWTVDQAMENMKIPEADRAKYAGEFKSRTSNTGYF